MANNFTAKVKETEDENEKLVLFKQGVHDVIKEVIGVAFEKADILHLVGSNPNFQPLQYYDPTAVFKQDMDSLQMGQVLSLIANVQNSVDKLAAASAGDGGAIIPRLEQVKNSCFVVKTTNQKIFRSLQIWTRKYQSKNILLLLKK